MANQPEMFRLAKKVMILCGLWRLKIKNMSKFQNIAYFVYSVFVHLMYVGVPGLMGAYLSSLFKTDTSEAMEALSKQLYCSLVVAKVITCQSKTILRTIEIAIEDESKLLAKNDPDLNEIYGKNVRRCNQICKFLLWTSVGMAIILIGMEMVDNYKVLSLQKYTNQSLAKPLPLALWYPIDRNKYHVWLLMQQLFNTILVSLSVGAVQICATTILAFFRAKLITLQYEFRNIRKDCGSVLPDTLRRTRMLCIEHQYLIECVCRVNDAFKYMIMSEYCLSSLMFASAVFQVIMDNNVYFNVEYTILMISQLMLLAWNSNEIMVQSSALSNALFESAWYEESEEVKILIKVMIMRCQKPLIISIGPFGPMTMDAAISRIKLAYSYTSVMTANL